MYTTGMVNIILIFIYNHFKGALTISQFNFMLFFLNIVHICTVLSSFQIYPLTNYEKPGRADVSKHPGFHSRSSSQIKQCLIRITAIVNSKLYNPLNRHKHCLLRNFHKLDLTLTVSQK